MFNKLVIALIFFVFSIGPAHAAVVINEFLPNPSGPSSEDSEWIELFNSDGNPVSLDNWKLDDIDGGGASPYVIASGSAIPANGFLVFEKTVTGIGLNNGGDTVRLINETDSVVDSYSFSSTTEDVSFGRSTNGGGSFVICQTQTKGSSNNCSPPSPTPQATATSAPTSTNTPSSAPTLVPTVAVILKTPIPTNKKTPTPIPQTNTPTPQSEVLGLLVVDGPASQSATPSGGFSFFQPLIISLLFVATGLALLGFVFILKKKKAGIVDT